MKKSITKKNYRKKYIFPIVLLILVISIMEIISYLSLFVIEKKNPGSIISLYIDNLYKEDAKKKTFERVKPKLHKKLGWFYPPNYKKTEKNSAGKIWSLNIDSDGSRRDKNNYPHTINTYGDSFTFCHEVDDNETWQYFLARKLNAKIKNYGVGGYSVYQSIIRMEMHIEQGNIAPITILAVTPPMLARCFNGFRATYCTAKSRFNFSPFFKFQNGEIVKYPLKKMPKNMEETKAMAIEKSRLDRWSSMVDLSFPYTPKIFTLAWRKHNAKEHLDIWGLEEGRVVFNIMIKRFKNKISKTKSRAVLVFISNKIQSPYKEYRDMIIKNHPDLLVIDVNKTPYVPRLYRVRWNGGHLSKYGNIVVANSIFTELTKDQVFTYPYK